MADSTVTLTAEPKNTTLPDGQTVPMWGYTCGAFSGTGVSCTATNGSPQSSTLWQPPLITVPAGQQLKITLINKLDFGADKQKIPTSLVIVGQLGGGLGATPARMRPNRPRAAGHNMARYAGRYRHERERVHRDERRLRLYASHHDSHAVASRLHH